MSRVVEIDDAQKGFKAEDGVAANLSIIKDLVRTAKAEKRPLYVAFVEFRKAFDSVFHRAILKSAGAAGLNEASVRYLQTVYSSLMTDVMGVRVGMTRGVAQGDPLSPTLFNLILQTALTKLPQDVGVPYGGELLRYLAFADDIVLVATSRSGLQVAIQTFTQEAKHLGLQPSINKCGTMGICVSRGT